jgi:D-alanyl-lipoteichoic acid acyltransferase DltB (MBOAT superfamily)
MSPFWHGFAWGCVAAGSFYTAVIVLADWSRKRGSR